MIIKYSVYFFRTLAVLTASVFVLQTTHAQQKLQSHKHVVSVPIHSVEWVGASIGEAVTLARSEHRDVLLAFMHSFTPQSIQFDSAIFHDENISLFIDAAYVPVRIECSPTKDSTIDALLNYFEIAGFPTIVVLDENAKEVDRIVGTASPEAVRKRLAEITDRSHVISIERSDAVRDSLNGSKWLALAHQYHERFMGDGYRAALERAFAVGRDTVREQADVELGTLALKKYRDTTRLVNFLHTHPKSMLRRDVYRELIAIAKNLKAWRSVLQWEDHVVREFGDADAMNDLAYDLASYNQDLPRAEKLSRVAIALSPRVAEYYDTLAEVLFRQKKFREALSAERKAAALDPEETYFSKRAKFFKESVKENFKK